MTWIILAIGLLFLLDINHRVGGQDLKTNTSTTSSSIDAKTENTTTIETSGKDDDTVDSFQDILFDPSLIVARLNRDVSNKGSTWSTDLSNVKNGRSSNVEEDLQTEEDRRYSAPYWYRRQDWQVDEQVPAYKQESYRRFLKYPIFSGR
ncbi:hypothetical protein M0804_006386 [Polistes exclamans]|nr:hypothetical protein M0804_006386 [Polistes exclamans]